MTQISHGFTLIKKTHVPELKTDASLYRHDKSGARLLSLENDDENKVFGVTFRTPPEDSTGLPHIMEHSVLCGSRKYPLKEPFIELVKGSLNTFLNAFTYPDKTCYPVASTNLKDFYNLVDVYLDAVLHPLIPPYVLEQEGWHYELHDEGDPLTYKGVVFNEMKGAYSSPEQRMEKHVSQVLFPDNEYSNDSGGDPTVMPDLTYEQFISFHETYYHPSNAFIYFYGDDDPKERLRLLDTYLNEFDAKEIHTEVSLQPKFSAPQTHTFSYDASEEEGGSSKGMASVNWLLDEGADPTLTFGLDILSHILIGNQAAPLRKALIDSGLGENLTRSGLEEQLRQLTFSVGLKGIAVKDAGKVESVILDTLASLAENGVDPETVEASINTNEFSLREFNTGGFPKGLAIMLHALTTWLYEGDPFEPLFYEGPLNAVKEMYAAGNGYFENLIRTQLLDNPHRVTVVLQPDAEIRAREEASEKQKLSAVHAQMTPEEISKVIENTKTLERIQSTPDSPEALATLPSLTLDDLDREITKIPTEKVFEHEVEILFHDLFTNGIIYLDLGFDVHTLPQDLIPYLPMFSRSFTGMGTETEDFVQLTRRIGRVTGGIYPSTFTSTMRNSTEGVVYLFLRGKATAEHAQDLLDILNDMLTTLKLDNQERFLQMVLESKAGKEARLAPSGHIMVNNRIRAHFTESAWVSEQMNGISSLQFIRKLVDEVQHDWPAVLEKLERIRAILLTRAGMICNVTLDSENWQVFRPLLAKFIGGLPDVEIEKRAWQRTEMPPNEAFTIPANVNYVGKAANLYERGFKDHGSIRVIRKYLNTSYLWEKVRVQGGAYGGFATFDYLSGTFAYLSYRDPNLTKTIDNYDGTPDFLHNLEISDEELTKTIIGTIGDLDGYQLPDAKGHTAMVRRLVGVSDEERQRIREEVLSTNPANFISFGEALLSVRDEGHVVVVGSAEAIEAANDEKGENWLPAEKLL